MTTRPDDRRRVALAARITAVLAVTLAGWLIMRGLPFRTKVPAPSARYVGRAAGAPCHAGETKRFTGSRHDVAMQPACRRQRALVEPAAELGARGA